MYPDTEKVWSAIVGILLGTWWVASAIHQFRFSWWQSIITRFDPLHLLPRWSFFAPNPGSHDIHVVYRDGSDLSMTDSGWCQIITSVRAPYRWLWNPCRYPEKASHDLANALLMSRQATNNDEQLLMLSVPYLSVLGWVMEQPYHLQNTVYRQFAIVRSQEAPMGRQLSINFISAIHHV